ncbi:hypothetical protein ACRALDRAFT_211385 [Sodiomyces alcalophilus JCM 7366]|uniref:uncharacterized protein n=1 Tax=Sodiomyces alcalophilus JCM 7366 TaxID=591952 RepID=UPI0039B3CA36
MPSSVRQSDKDAVKSSRTNYRVLFRLAIQDSQTVGVGSWATGWRLRLGLLPSQPSRTGALSAFAISFPEFKCYHWASLPRGVRAIDDYQRLGTLVDSSRLWKLVEYDKGSQRVGMREGIELWATGAIRVGQMDRGDLGRNEEEEEEERREVEAVEILVGLFHVCEYVIYPSPAHTRAGVLVINNLISLVISSLATEPFHDDVQHNTNLGIASYSEVAARIRQFSMDRQDISMENHPWTVDFSTRNPTRRTKTVDKRSVDGLLFVVSIARLY